MSDEKPSTDQLRDKVIDAIKQVYDPEIPVNIYELGLIYEVAIDEENAVAVKMTLTAPSCPSAQEIPAKVQMVAEAVPEVKSATVDIVWDPPWTPALMSEAAKLTTGIM